MKKLFAFSMLMALTLVSTPAFALTQGTRSENQIFNVTVPDWFNITKASNVNSADINITTTNNQADHVAKTSAQMDVTFTVSTNIPADATNTKLALTAKTGTGNLAALYPATGGLTGKIVFVKNDIAGATAAISNAGGDSAAVTSNANTIAIPYSTTVYTNTPADGTAAANLDNPTVGTNEVDYTMKPGYNTITITIGQADTTISENTFSMLDEPGTYSATIYADGPSITP